MIAGDTLIVVATHNERKKIEALATQTLDHAPDCHILEVIEDV
jgi:hypothetical protein